jgi:hypothetical protein
MGMVAACSSTTMIRSNVPGAKVYLNGEFVGQTPYPMTDTKIVGSATQVRIEAPGYHPTNAVITRNEQFSVGACIGGVLVLVPFLWIMEYKPDRFYELVPAHGPVGPYPPPPGPPPAGSWPPPGQAPPGAP